MSKHARDNRPHLPPVTRVELSQSNIRLRWIAIGILLAVAVAAIGYGSVLALRPEPGWQEIQPQTQLVNCGSDFAMMYDFTGDGSAATGKYKQLQFFYGELAARAYQLFVVEAEGSDGLWAVNDQVNETVTVAPEVYGALAQIAESGSRHAFLAPATEFYQPVFLCAGDSEAAMYDPMKAPERMKLVRETVQYCADPEMVRLELVGENQVQLIVAPEYLSFARENGIEIFLDLGWMTNAFVADFLARGFMEKGYDRGYLSSYDGFTRNLDASGSCSVNFYDRQGADVAMPARLDYSGAMSVVMLRDYPMSERDQWHYYAYADGSITSVLLDPEDGVSKASVDSLMAYSETAGCGEMVLKLAPVFTAEAFDSARLGSLSAQGIHSLWYQDTTLCHTQEDAPVTLLPNSGGENYTIE